MAGAFAAAAFSTAFDIGTLPDVQPQGTSGARIASETIDNQSTVSVRRGSTRTL